MNRLLDWIYKHEFLTGLILFALFVVSLFLLEGCTTTPTPEPPKTATIQIHNSLDVFYTVIINEQHYIVQPGETVEVVLPLKTYKVCVSQEFELESKCVQKNVTGDDTWTIRNKNG